MDVGGAPPWLVVASDQLRLLPDTEDRLVVRFRIDSATLVPAGERSVRLRVRSLTRAPAHEIVAVTLSVPVVDAPVTVRVEPSIARAKDVDTARLAVVVDNAAANRPATVRLAGSDPELAVAFHFDPAEITVGPGESTRVRLVTTSARPEPGREITRSLTVSATEGRRRVDATAMLVQSTSLVVEDPMVELTATPSLVRLRDDDSTVVRLTVGNQAGRQWATVRLDAADPERLVHAGWSASEVRVPPGGSTDVDVRLSCPAIEPGTEVTREVALVASDGKRTARTPVTLRQSASVSPMTTLAVRLDPSVVRLANRRRGSSAVIVDNGQGRAPIRVWLRGDDPENVLAFTFTPAQLEIPAGQSVTSRMTFSAPRAPGGREITRSFTVAATDGRSAATTTGSIIQSASDRRPWARVLLTIGGAVGDPAGRDAAVRRSRGHRRWVWTTTPWNRRWQQRSLHGRAGRSARAALGRTRADRARRPDGLRAHGDVGAADPVDGAAGGRRAGRGRGGVQAVRPRFRRDRDRAGLRARLHRWAAASSLIRTASMCSSPTSVTKSHRTQPLRSWRSARSAPGSSPSWR